MKRRGSRASRWAALTLVKETTRAVWVSTRLEQLVQDLRAGSRIVTGLTAAAVALVALVIGGNTTAACSRCSGWLAGRLLPASPPGVAHRSDQGAALQLAKAAARRLPPRD